MEIEFDPQKNAQNIALRGLSFELARECEWMKARVWRDMRKDYGEARFCALVPRRQRLLAVVFTTRGDTMRIISLRKANKREEIRYEKETS